MSRKTDPKMLQAKLEAAKTEGKEIDLDYEDTTGVIDVTLQRGQACADAGVAVVKRIVKKLDGIAIPVGKPAGG